MVLDSNAASERSCDTPFELEGAIVDWLREVCQEMVSICSPDTYVLDAVTPGGDDVRLLVTGASLAYVSRGRIPPRSVSVPRVALSIK